MEFSNGVFPNDWNIETDGPLPEHCACFDVEPSVDIGEPIDISDEGYKGVLEYRPSPATGDIAGGLVFPAVLMTVIFFVLLIVAIKEGRK